MGLLSLLRGGSLAGADGPDRLVCDDDLVPLLGGAGSLDGLELLGKDLLCAGFLALLLGLTDAVDDAEVGSEARLELLNKSSLGLAKDVTTLAVPQDHPLEAKVRDELGGELTGEGALLGPAVLGGHLVGGDEGALGHVEVDGGGSADDLNVAGKGCGGGVELLHELGESGNHAVALPVSSDKESTHLFSF